MENLENKLKTNKTTGPLDGQFEVLVIFFL